MKDLQELEQTAEQEPEELLATTTPAPARKQSSASHSGAPRDLAGLSDLAKAVEFNLSQQTQRTHGLVEIVTKLSSNLENLISRLEASQDILEEHTASLEEAMERIETVTAAYIRLTMEQTNRREHSQPQPTNTSGSAPAPETPPTR